MKPSDSVSFEQIKETIQCTRFIFIGMRMEHGSTAREPYVKQLDVEICKPRKRSREDESLKENFPGGRKLGRIQKETLYGGRNR